MADEKIIDFGNEESCKNYLISKFDDLLLGINNLYGRELMEELLKRMEKTIGLFHQDVKNLLNDIRTPDAVPPVFQSPQTIPPRVTSQPLGKTPVTPVSSIEPTVGDGSDWEKHLT